MTNTEGAGWEVKVQANGKTGDLKKLRSQSEDCRKRPKTAKTGRIFVTLCFSQEIYTSIRYRYLKKTNKTNKKKQNRVVASHSSFS